MEQLSMARLAPVARRAAVAGVAGPCGGGAGISDILFIYLLNPTPPNSSSVLKITFAGLFEAAFLPIGGNIHHHLCRVIFFSFPSFICYKCDTLPCGDFLLFIVRRRQYISIIN